MVYVISYEVNEMLYDYTALVEAIKSIGPYQHPMKNLWFVRSDNSDVNTISDMVKSHFQSPTDFLYVMEVPAEVKRQGWLPKTFWSWLRNVSSND